MKNETNKLTKRERKKLAKEEKRRVAEKSAKSAKMKGMLIATAIAAVVIYGGFKIINWINTPSIEVSPSDLTITDADWVKGDREASVVLYEFSDFQCPACATYYPILEQAAEEFSEVALVYRHYPLDQHKNARPSAYAAEAAGAQGKFWEMHNLLFDNQDEWEEERKPEDKFISYAESLELDIDQFKTDLESESIKNKVDQDWQTAFALRINSTPTVIIDGEKIQLPASYGGLKSLIESKINSASESS